MNRLPALAISLGGLAIATAAVAMPSTVGAQTPTTTPTAGARKAAPERPAKRPRANEVAVVFGQVSGGEATVIDFKAGEGDGGSLGHLRFWTEDDGFYNGVSRKVEINGQDVHAEGAGPLLKADGTRTRVRFSLDFDGSTHEVSVHITGPGIDYTVAGTVEGRVYVGPPPTATPKP